MKKNFLAKEIILSFALCLFIISPAPLGFLLDKYPVLPKGICEIIGGIGATNLLSLYALQHFYLAIVLRSAIKKAREYRRKGLLLPAIPLVFAVLAFISVGVHAVKLATLGWVIYAVIFALFYLAAIFLELFAPKLKFKKELTESVFILLAFLLTFFAAPFITDTISLVSNDSFGFGFILSIFTVFPVLFISAGIYMGAKKCRFFLLSLIEGAVFLLAASQKGLDSEILLFAAVYTALSCISHAAAYSAREIKGTENSAPNEQNT
jgi:hypothetical protein